MGWLAVGFLAWLGGWAINIRLAALPKSRLTGLAIPMIFGLSLVVIWESMVRGFDVSPILLPAPSVISVKFAGSLGILWQDFVQTVVKGALSGYAIGCGSAFALAELRAQRDGLQRTVTSLQNGHKVELNTVKGQAKATVAEVTMQRDLMRTYAAGYWQTLLKLRLPAAMPFVFNGLKVTTTLALIGAIVAEFFGSPIKGMGFRISTEVGRLALDMVWAEITVAALAGSAFYGSVAMIEKKVTFWHPSQRG